MNQTFHKILSITFSGLALLLFIILLSMISNRNIWINTEAMLLMLGGILLLGGSALFLGRNIWTFAANRRNFWLLCFFIYLVFLSYLLFFSKDFARDRVDLNDAGNYWFYLKMQWTYSVNLTPFSSIRTMISVLDSGYMQYSVMNLAGNIVAFMPFAFFFKLLWKKVGWLRFFLYISTIVIAVELIQFFTLTGSMDIDDYILNVAGAMVCYAILSIPFCKRCLQKIKDMY